MTASTMPPRERPLTAEAQEDIVLRLLLEMKRIEEIPGGCTEILKSQCPSKCTKVTIEETFQDVHPRCRVLAGQEEIIIYIENYC